MTGLGDFLRISPVHIGDGWQSDAVRHGQDVFHFPTVERRGYRTAEDDRIRQGLPGEYASLHTALAEVHDRPDPVGAGRLFEFMHIVDQGVFGYFPQIPVLESVGRGYELLQGHSGFYLHACVGAVGVSVDHSGDHDTDGVRDVWCLTLPYLDGLPAFHEGISVTESFSVVDLAGQTFHAPGDGVRRIKTARRYGRT